MSERPCPTWVPAGDPNIPNSDRERCAVKGPHTVHSAGLQQRYRVEKINDPAGKHDECRYFVLDPQHDPFARVALLAYAAAVEREVDEGHFRRKAGKQLAADLRAWLRRT